MTKRHGPEEFQEEPPLFARQAVPLARRTDPDTSHAAALSMLQPAETQRRDLLAALVRAGQRGLTCDEADADLGWRPTTAGRRMPELATLQSARDSGQRRKTQSGRMAIVWVIAG